MFYRGDETEGEMDRVRTRVGKGKIGAGFQLESPKEGDHCEERDVDGRTI